MTIPCRGTVAVGDPRARSVRPAEGRSESQQNAAHPHVPSTRSIVSKPPCSAASPPATRTRVESRNRTGASERYDRGRHW